MTRHKVLLVFGTRPETIKMAPVVHALRESPRLEPRVCVTAQHRQQLDQMLGVFGITPDVDLDLMRPAQRLEELTARVLVEVTRAIEAERPAVVLVHGDTTTTFAAALAAFYLGVPVGHVEAGLRSHDLTRPFPEEANRVLADRLCRFFYCPTEGARRNLLAEGQPPERLVVTGNTCVDAIRMVLPEARRTPVPELSRLLATPRSERRMILVTAHRRESFGSVFEDMCRAMRDVADRWPDVHVVYPVHLNPNVQRPVHAILGGHPRIHLLEPLSYLPFVRLMDECFLALTDSGGIQEEAPGLHRPVLVMREVTERPEGVEAGTTRLVGCTRGGILEGVADLLDHPAVYEDMARRPSPFGDGWAGQRIAAHLEGAL
jgi:UDP-N-acetylglucosamine 2-epimerase (non-hydrolysing)